MLKSIVHRAKVRTVQTVLSKRTVKVAARFLAGRDGVEIFDKAMAYLKSMLGSGKEADKMINKSIRVMSELVVLLSERKIRESELEDTWQRIEEACERIEDDEIENMVLDLDHLDEGTGDDLELEVAAEDGREYEKMTSEVLTQVTSILIDSLGHHFAPAAVKKFREITEKLRQPKVLTELCWTNSPTNAILMDLVEKIGRMSGAGAEGRLGGPAAWARIGDSAHGGQPTIRGFERLSIKPAPAPKSDPGHRLGDK